MNAFNTQKVPAHAGPSANHDPRKLIKRMPFIRALYCFDLNVLNSEVLAAEGFGGQGGGQSAWPPLLKRQLLGRKN